MPLSVRSQNYLMVKLNVCKVCTTKSYVKKKKNTRVILLIKYFFQGHRIPGQKFAFRTKNKYHYIVIVCTCRLVVSQSMSIRIYLSVPKPIVIMTYKRTVNSRIAIISYFLFWYIYYRP